MKNQLKYLLPMLLLLPILSYTGCKEDDDPIDPLELLPPLTNTGENTFGCLVNGEAFVTKSSTKAVAIVQGGFLQLFGNMEAKQADNTVSISLAEYPSVKTYVINDRNPGEGRYRILHSNCRYETNTEFTGILTITTFDTKSYIISGTFEFTAILNIADSGEGCQDTVRVTDGRFDIKYIP